MFAGQGTSHVGVGRCFKHGGASTTHVKNALSVVVQQRLHAEAESLADEDAQPHAILKQLLKMTGGRLKWLDSELAREHSTAAERLFKEERQFLSWISKLASEVKLEEVEANVRVAQASLMAKMVQEAATRAGLSGRQVAALGIGLRGIALEAQGDTAAAEVEARRLGTIREEIAADDQRRIEREAQRLTGLVPASEIAPGEDTRWLEPAEQVEPDGAPEQEPPSTPRQRRSPAAPATNYKSDLPGSGLPGGEF
jgi:hypothetical protein